MISFGPSKIPDNLTNQLYVYLCSLFLYNLARVLPHAILTVILLNKGMTIGNIALIQSFYMLATLLFELPSGILSDLWSEKKMYLISLLLLLISYIVIMLFSSLPTLCFAWFIYGLSSSAMSGSLDSFFVRQFKNNNKQIKQFHIKFNNTTILSSLVGGALGSFIYTYLNAGLYLISIILLTIAAILVAYIIPSQTNTRTQRFTFPKLTSLFFKNHVICIDIILLAVLQIIAQLFFQFWQVLFLDAHISSQFFGLFYLVFQIISLIANLLFKKFNVDHFLPGLLLLLVITLCLSISVISNALLFVCLICLFLIPFNLYSSQLLLNIQQQSKEQFVATTLALSGTLNGIISMIFLWLVSLLTTHFAFMTILFYATLFCGFLSLSLLFIRRYLNHLKSDIT